MLIFARKTFDFFDLRCNLDEKNKIESSQFSKHQHLRLKNFQKRRKNWIKKYKKKNKNTKKKKKKKKEKSIGSS